MGSRGPPRSDLEPYIGSRARVAEVLNRKRPLSLNMIRRLYAGLGIPASRARPTLHHCREASGLLNRSATSLMSLVWRDSDAGGSEVE